MIQVYDLRIGNWIIDIACGRMQVRGELLDEALWRRENAMPIPVTNEILLKCEFKRGKIKGVTRFVDDINDSDPAELTVNL